MNCSLRGSLGIPNGSCIIYQLLSCETEMWSIFLCSLSPSLWNRNHKSRQMSVGLAPWLTATIIRPDFLSQVLYFSYSLLCRFFVLCISSYFVMEQKDSVCKAQMTACSVSRSTGKLSGDQRENPAPEQAGFKLYELSPALRYVRQSFLQNLGQTQRQKIRYWL